MNFFEQPILNSPYAYPNRHWELDADGRPTNRIIDTRRRADLIAPIPQPKKVKRTAEQAEMRFHRDNGLSGDEQEYNPTWVINEIRGHLDAWRALPNPEQWQVTPETARLLQHWRSHEFSDMRPFFCQVEAVETAIWLAEVGPKMGRRGARFLEHLANANAQANPDLFRLALKLATGAGKTTVMAMLIAWQVVNAVRHPSSRHFSRGFLVVTPGITIRDRLRVLLPNDPDSYYTRRELVPADMLPEIGKAKIVITNYHAFKLRERISLSKGSRAFLSGRGPGIETTETEGQMLQRVMPELMGLKNIVVINDEAHHCYRERPDTDAAADLKGDERKEAQDNNEAARLWISGIETVKRQLGVGAVYDLSATPFFLNGSGWVEGTLFPWTVSDFSLMDAIECGIVKLPRVPVADNLPGGREPLYRKLWDAIGKKMPKKQRGEKKPDPHKLPLELQTALEALYGHYKKTFEAWQEAGVGVPPVFIVVCNNTTNSELVHDYIAGFEREDENGRTTWHPPRLPLFSNYDEHGNPYSRPRTLLIDSAQIDSGERIDDRFKEAAQAEIEKFRREKAEREGQEAARTITDEEILREVMNTVGKKDRLGEQIRCVVSVSMLTEGWDANTVTHILGVRAFGTKLICEQVIGRGLRRLSYDLNEEGRFGVEYADIMGIDGLNFSAQAIAAPVKPPREVTHVRAVRPDRDALEIKFPNVDGYRVELPDTRLVADFSKTEVLELTPERVGPSIVNMQGIIGAGEILTIEHLKDTRHSTIIYHLAKHLIYEKFRDPGEEPKLHLFGQARRIVRQWLDGGYLKCSGGTYPAQLLYRQLADDACDRIAGGITEELGKERPIKAVIDPYNPTGSTALVNFNTTRPVWHTDPSRCHVNALVIDSDWEADFCRVAEAHPRVIAYAKNHNLGFEVPYLMGSTQRRYRPDFIVLVDDGGEETLNLVVEVKGYRGEDARAKANTMNNYWIPGVNNLGRFGRWAFVEFTEVFEMEAEFNRLITSFTAREPA